MPTHLESTHQLQPLDKFIQWLYDSMSSSLWHLNLHLSLDNESKTARFLFLWRKKDVILTVNSVLADSLLIAWCQSLWCWDLKHHLFPLGQSGTTSTSTLQLAMFWISFPFGTKCIVFCTCLLLTYQSVLFLCQFFSF